MAFSVPKFQVLYHIHIYIYCQAYIPLRGPYVGLMVGTSNESVPETAMSYQRYKLGPPVM